MNLNRRLLRLIPVFLILPRASTAQSTTTAYQCEQAFEAAMMPILNPATIQDYLDLGLFGFALSRFSGCWVAFKAASEAVDSSASVYVDPQRVTVTMPGDFAMPPGGLHIRWPRGGSVICGSIQGIFSPAQL